MKGSNKHQIRITRHADNIIQKKKESWSNRYGISRFSLLSFPSLFITSTELETHDK
jgi:hypothetical protein